ncbi:hypothetical protein [Sinomonas halotolerans]|uniref:Uncharacterized protein n=1 Tax=Sinomonas halotolerans TaxID=1644133 RepID=A0ABU9X6P4_9MICC
MWLGLGIGVVAIPLLAFLATAIGSSLPLDSSLLGMGFLWWGPFFAYLVVAIVLASRPTTTRTGAGLLLAIGAWILIGAGVCVALIAQFSSGGY